MKDISDNPDEAFYCEDGRALKALDPNTEQYSTPLKIPPPIFLPYAILETIPLGY